MAEDQELLRLSRHVNRKLTEYGQRILAGEVSLAPYELQDDNACRFCTFHSVCGFDLKTDGYGFRRFRPMKAEEIWKEIDPEESDENETEEQESGNRKPEPGRRKDGEEKM